MVQLVSDRTSVLWIKGMVSSYVYNNNNLLPLAVLKNISVICHPDCLIVSVVVLCV